MIFSGEQEIDAKKEKRSEFEKPEYYIKVRSVLCYCKTVLNLFLNSTICFITWI